MWYALHRMLSDRSVECFCGVPLHAVQGSPGDAGGIPVGCHRQPHTPDLTVSALSCRDHACALGRLGVLEPLLARCGPMLSPAVSALRPVLHVLLRSGTLASLLGSYAACPVLTKPEQHPGASLVHLLASVLRCPYSFATSPHVVSVPPVPIPLCLPPLFRCVQVPPQQRLL